MTRVKICGITRPEDAELAIELGAWALGFVLWPGSVRACDPAVAAGMSQALRRRVSTVAVLMDPTLDEVDAAVEAGSYAYVQLHGDAGPAFCAEVQRRTGVRVMKAVNVRTAEDVQQLDRYRNVDLHLLDGRSSGAGETWDWALAAGRRTRVPLVLSGGLTPANVGAGIAAVDPYAVDVASGVEASHGIKDPELLTAFFEAVRAAAPADEAATGEAARA